LIAASAKNSGPLEGPIAGVPDEPADNAQRVDKWLWCARIFKTRTLSAKFVSDGRLRLSRNGETVRIKKPSFLVRRDDELAFSIGERLFVLKIVGHGARRGPAIEAQALYDDLSPPPPAKADIEAKDFAREKGDGRPTKKDRRALDALKHSH